MDPWNTSLELGVPEIDEAHRRLDELMQVTLEATVQGSASAVDAGLDAIASEATKHFALEEAYMKQSAFGGGDAHREAHATYLKDFGRAQQEFTASGVSPMFRIWFTSRLAPWLRLHVRGLDAQFARHYRAWQEEQAKAAEAKLVAEANASPEVDSPKARGSPDKH
jgi:hemerythrin-like metal-binding protein